MERCQNAFKRSFGRDLPDNLEDLSPEDYDKYGKDRLKSRAISLLEKEEGTKIRYVGPYSQLGEGPHCECPECGEDIDLGAYWKDEERKCGCGHDIFPEDEEVKEVLYKAFGVMETQFSGP